MRTPKKIISVYSFLYSTLCILAPLPEGSEVSGRMYSCYCDRPGNRVINAEFWFIVGFEFTLQMAYIFMPPPLKMSQF